VIDCVASISISAMLKSIKPHIPKSSSSCYRMVAKQDLIQSSIFVIQKLTQDFCNKYKWRHADQRII
jgi:hypothetical protein